MKKKIISVLILAAICYVGFAAIMALMQNSLIYHGQPIDKPTPDNVTAINVTTDDGQALTGWYIAGEPAKPTILHFHGNVGNIEWRYVKVMHYVNAGYPVLLAGYRGYGGNSGTPNEQGLYEDARAYIKWLKSEKQLNENQIILYGESLGSGVATQMANEINEAALILEAPFTRLPDVAAQTYFFLPVHLLMTEKFHNIDKIATIQSPLFIVHGERDLVTYAKQAQALYNAAEEPKELLLIPEAGHNNLYDYNAPLQIIDFLSRINPDPPDAS
jgi:fermentation-respiration switch protein FrsA (DUF1100 family)